MADSGLSERVLGWEVTSAEGVILFTAVYSCTSNGINDVILTMDIGVTQRYTMSVGVILCYTVIPLTTT